MDFKHKLLSSANNFYSYVGECDLCNATCIIFKCKYCQHKLCEHCLRITSIDKDIKNICPFCNEGSCNCSLNLEDQISDDYHDYDDVIVKDDTKNTQECIICYDRFNEDNIIKCKHCNQSYCIICFIKNILLNNTNPICAYCRQPISKKEKIQTQYQLRLKYWDFIDKKYKLKHCSVCGCKYHFRHLCVIDGGIKQ